MASAEAWCVAPHDCGRDATEELRRRVHAQHVQNNKVNPSKDLQNLSAELLGVVL